MFNNQFFKKKKKKVVYNIYIYIGNDILLKKIRQKRMVAKERERERREYNGCEILL